jgi:hypothetical protein
MTKLSNNSSFSHITNQTILLFPVWIIGFVLIFTGIDEAILCTVLLFSFVVISGLWLCNNIRIKLADPKLHWLGYFWLIKVLITLFLLFFVWIPELNPYESSNWGYDPQRFYYNAIDLIENNFQFPLGYKTPGVFYYYAVILSLFGQNPLVPALINLIITLIGTLYLIKVGYMTKSVGNKKKWLLAFSLLLPEIIWFDIMTARESINAITLIIFTLVSGKLVLGVYKKARIKKIFIIILSFFLLLAIRPSTIIPALIIVIILSIIKQNQSGKIINLRSVIIITLVFISIPIYNIFFSASFDILYTVSNKLFGQAEYNEGLNFEWSKNSIGARLIPNNFLESIIFLFPRSIMYIVAPLPNFNIYFMDLLNGYWTAWESIFTLLGGIINVIAIPYSMSGSFYSFKNRKKSINPLLIHISFWVTLAAVAGGNVIIHERYRLIMTMFLFASAWLGYIQCKRVQIQYFKLIWYSIIISFGVLYIFLKFL